MSWQLDNEAWQLWVITTALVILALPPSALGQCIWLAAVAVDFATRALVGARS